MPTLDKPLFETLVDLLLPWVNSQHEAETLLTLALGPNAATRALLRLEGTPRDRAVTIVQRLSRDELWAVLQTANVSADWTAKIDALRDRLFSTGDSVFISYARPDAAVAERVEVHLKAAGFRVFRDTSDLRGGEWDMMIETALRDCDRLVLLLSPHSMPHRKEVHREWFYFDQHQKPLHPLLIETCDLHSRMLAYNFRDARRDLAAALDLLVGDLRQPFQRLTERATADPFARYYQGRLEELSQPRYALDRRFVRLTLLVDQGEKADGVRWINPQPNRKFDDLRDVLAELEQHPAIVLLGAPGSGKSTLLRRLQLDECASRLSEGGRVVPFFAPLNAYRAPADDQPLPSPRDWLVARWTAENPDLPPLADLLREGRVLLLLDALNEMPHRDNTAYRERVGRWRDFLKGLPSGNRAVITCRTLNYSALLSAPPDFPVPQVELQPMTGEQMEAFLLAYLPESGAGVWAALKDTPQRVVFAAPFFLRLLVEQIERAGAIPAGRAALFAGFVRGALQREIGRENRLFDPDTLLTERDHQQIAQNRWKSPYDLPTRGLLIPRLSALAHGMQANGVRGEGGQVLIDFAAACDLLAHERDEDILKAGEALNVLDEDTARDEVRFLHQLLQEFFAARVLAAQPDADTVRVEWRADRVTPSLEETLAGLADSDPLPPLATTGWEETTVLAAGMSENADRFVRGLLDANLPLAARCAAAPEVQASAGLQAELRRLLVARSQDWANADVRARIEAGLALGVLGDPRFERRTGAYGDYLLPPLATISAGVYPMGNDNGNYNDEKPAHIVRLEAFQIGVFPVTNAEYALFMAAGGYKDERWWETDAAKAWLRGEGSTDGQKAGWRDLRDTLRKNWTDDTIED